MFAMIKNYFAEVGDMLEAISTVQLQQVLFILEQAYRNNRRVFVMGNGGSAATASHFALDLAKNTVAGECRRLRVIALTDNVPLITALSNDYTYESIFAEQLVNLIEVGDVVIGISASGNSLNVVNACCLAKQEGAMTIGLLGADGGKMKEVVDAYVLAPGQNIEQEEDAHMIITHVITRHMRNFIRCFNPQQFQSSTGMGVTTDTGQKKSITDERSQQELVFPMASVGYTLEHQ